MIGHIKSYVINELLDKDIAIGDILKAIMGGDDYKQASSKIVDAIEDYLSKSTEDDSFNDLLTSHISDYISDKYPHNASIETMMPDNAEEKLKVILEGQKDKISQFIVDESRNEEVVAKLKVIVANLLMEKVGGAMAAMFVNPDDVALSILDYVGKTVFEPEVQDGMIMALVRGGVSQSKQMTLSEVLSIENYDDMLKHMIESIVSNATEVTKQMNMKPLIESGVHYFLSMKLHLSQPDKEKIETQVELLYKSFVDKNIGTFLETFELRSIVETEVNSFSVADVEKLIFTIVDKELKAITWFGALLGFAMGMVMIVL